MLASFKLCTENPKFRVPQEIEKRFSMYDESLALGSCALLSI